eukprot:NODE_2430_length_1202_cov_27.017346_g2217_i0.p1 GENE.NODE_2430_length_1202_cov_27.017346_g2217_i0~~NODE_2430_length_1202_cov_27.017346_g2217_i0.p1  ORF type:complete len:297 (-),score=39.86 NODE_2430_length_1202_cov_27.017346_g2217_i0:138-1028(-)
MAFSSQSLSTSALIALVLALTVLWLGGVVPSPMYFALLPFASLHFLFFRLLRLTRAGQRVSYAATPPGSPRTALGTPLLPPELVRGPARRGTPPPQLLPKDDLLQIVAQLPLRCQCTDHWSLRYSSLQHGSSLSTLYANLRNAPNVALVLETLQGERFGFFTPSALSRHGAHYFGSRETIVFTLSPTFQTFRWTGTNDYLILAEPHRLAIGGGRSGSALLLDASLAFGTTCPCDTFNSPALVQRSVRGDDAAVEFEVHVVEAWHVPSPDCIALPLKEPTQESPWKETEGKRVSFME